jgi:predicted membrane protein
LFQFNLLLKLYNILFISIIYYMYSFRFRKNNNRNLIFGLSKQNNINSSNNFLRSPIISRINQKNYSCGSCGRK